MSEVMKRRAGAFVVSEANGDRSREVVTLATGNGEVEAGTVLGEVTASGKYVPWDAGATDGSETAAAVCFDTKDTAAGDVEAVVIARAAEVNGNELSKKNAGDTIPTNFGDGIVVR